MEHSKKTAKGRCERGNVLAEFVDRQMIEEWLKKARGSGRRLTISSTALALCPQVSDAAGARLSPYSAVVSTQGRLHLAMEMVF